MYWQFNWYVFALAANTIFAALLFFITWKLRKTEGVIYFALFLLGCTIWDFSAIFELSSSVLSIKILFSKISYFGAATVANFWYFFAANFSQKHKIKKQKTYFLFWIVPVLILIFTWTNEYHHLIWPEVYLTNSPFGIIAIYKHGILFFVNVVYSYCLLFLGTIILIKEALGFPKIYRYHSFILIVAVCIPWIGDVLYVLGLSPTKGLDFGTFAFTISAVLIVFGYIRLRLFAITPIAQEFIFSNISEGIIVTNTKNNFIQMNKAAENIFSRRFKEGENIEEILNQFLPQLKLDDFEKTQVSNSNVSIDQYWYEIKLSPIKNFRGNYIGKIFIFRDITDRKKSEEALKASEKHLRELNEIKNRFFSILSHDLRGPFSGIMGFIDILQEDFNELSDEEKLEFVVQLNQTIKVVYQLLEDLLQWSRLNMDSFKAEIKSINIFDEVEKTFDLLKHNAQKKRIGLINEINPQYIALGDSSMIKLLLRNLISNAIKFSKPGGNIKLSSKIINSSLEVSVIDSGVGIPPEVVPNLFRLDIKYSTPGTADEIGSGIGLVLCKDILDKLNGKIWVASELGRGSTFSFTLPLH